MNIPLINKDLLPSYHTVSEDSTVKPSNFQKRTLKINDLTDFRTITFNFVKDPLMVNRNPSDAISNGTTIIHILKGNIGTGILALPLAFTYSGLAFGVIGLLLVAVVCIHSMHLIVRCSQALCCRAFCPPLDYASTAEKAFETGPKVCRPFAKFARLFTNFYLIVAQTGLCVVYWVFAATNLQMAVSYFDNNFVSDYRIYMLMLLLPLLAMVLLPSLKHFAPFSLVANICEVTALGMLFYYIFQELPPVDSRRQLPSLETLPLWFGTVIYSVEIIALILPLENVMKRPRDMTGWNGVLNTSMSLVCVLYVAVSFFGYLRFGDDLKGSITLSLPTERLSVLIQILYATGIYFSFPLQYYVPVEILRPKIKSYFSNHEVAALIVLKIVLIAFIFALGALIPEFELFISLVGAFGGTFLCIIFPPVIHMVTFWDYGLSWPSTIKDIVIVIFGLVGSVFGTYASVLAIVNEFMN